MSTLTAQPPAAPGAAFAPTEADLAQAIRTLQFMAVQTITKLIGIETDPRELRRLLTLAPRFRIPGFSRPPSSPRPPSARSSPSSPSASAQRAEQTPSSVVPPYAIDKEEQSKNTEPPRSLPSYANLPPLLPMSDDQFHALTKQIGFTEATRRRALLAAAIAADRKYARGIG